MTVLRDVLQDVPDSPFSVWRCETQGDGYGSLVVLVVCQEEVAKEYMGKSYFSGGGRRGMARRIAWDEPCLTLTTSPSQKQTERCHPDETRPFTVREYARIQSFPDSWNFAGSVGEQYKQIGNAVPAELARRIGLQIVEALNGEGDKE